MRQLECEYKGVFTQEDYPTDAGRKRSEDQFKKVINGVARAMEREFEDVSVLRQFAGVYLNPIVGLACLWLREKPIVGGRYYAAAKGSIIPLRNKLVVLSGEADKGLVRMDADQLADMCVQDLDTETFPKTYRLPEYDTPAIVHKAARALVNLNFRLPVRRNVGDPHNQRPPYNYELFEVRSAPTE